MKQEELENLTRQNAHHIKVINGEVGELCDEQRESRREHKEMAEILTKAVNDIDWLKRFFWIVATASVGSLVTGLLQLLIK